MRWQWYLCLICLTSMILITGCTNAKQLTRISFVTAIGIDKKDSGVIVHALIAVPGKFSSIAPGGGGGGAAGENPNYIISAEAPNIGDALFKMKRDTARSLNYGHTRVILFSDEMAKAGIDRFLDIFMRREEFQINAWVAITHGSTKKVLQTRPQVPESLTDYLVDVLSEAGSDSMEIYPIYLYQFYSYLNEPGRSPFSLAIDTQKEGNKLQLTDLVLFNKGKMVGSLTPKETKYLQLISGNHLKSASFTVKDRNYVLLKYHVKPKVTDEGIKLNLSFQLELDENSSESTIPLSKMKEMESTIRDTFKGEIEKLIKKLQKLKSDPAGFGEKYRVAHGGDLQAEKWLEELFPNLPVDVKVDVNIERTGMLF